MIPYGKQSITDEDVDSVVKVLRSDFLTQGPKVPEFEYAVANYCNAKYGIAVNSATSALHIACLALGLGKGDFLWTSPNTFVASANCALYCGASVDFVDINPCTYNMDVENLEEKLKIAEVEGRLPKIVIPVHFAGQSCDMKKIWKLSKKYGFSIIEDASHCIGGKYLECAIGSCDYSDITVFSFHPVKIITTAEGGLATTNSKELATKMNLYRSHGVTRDTALLIDKDTEKTWYYEQHELGLNYRMTELQAALGISQISRVDSFVAYRNQFAENYNELLADLPLITPAQSELCYSAFHLYPIQLKLDEISSTRAEIFNQLRANDIGVNVHYIPVHVHPYYKKLGFYEGMFPVAEHYYERAISLPLFHGISLEQQSTVVSTLRKVLI